ncbi:sugar ABC transporter permease [Marispirochaeta sp.]|uniref:carbohydrate ABC transporter permease n=1 Tax=Marispirochaeta sp. TaxID=2038653 RepID=UPI0029C8DBF8|nr:sugar ABC transporter permease [Marispirochaeta sp.]
MNTAMAKLRVRKRYNYAGLLYISPWIIGMLVFQLYPFIASLVYSFTTFSILTPPKFVGLQNFIKIFTNDRIFYQSLKVTLIYVFIAVPAKLAFALFIAMVLNIKIKYVNFYRTVYYMPSILGGSVAVSILWKFLFARRGLINQFLLDIGLPYVDWLGSPKWALYTISLLTVWQFGSSMVIFLAGLKQIPGELYDAAKVDGAGRIRTFMNITLPLITPMIFFNLIMQMVNAFQQFTAAFVITNGGPMKATYLYGVMIYENAFNFFKMGYASALSWVLFVIMMAFTAMVFKSSPFWTHYEDGGEF